MDYIKMAFNAVYTFENVPKVMHKWVIASFIKRRNIAADVFSKWIGVVNEEWDKTGKSTLRDGVEKFTYIEDVNPEYTRFIAMKIQPKIDEVNRFHLLEMWIDEFGDLCGRIKGLNNSKITLELKEVKKP